MNIVVHVPHASTHVPNELRAQFLLSADALLDEAIQSADLYTDDLSRCAFPNATHIIADISRIVVDVERYEIDAEEVMAKQGRGVIYFKTRQGHPLRRPISLEERNKLLEFFYTPHWSKLKAAAKDQVLIDLHSYPVHPWPIELNTDANRPEIDIGTSDVLTPKQWLKAMIEHFEGAGFSVGVNTPYAGVIDAGSKYAVMIEIRRDLMDPKQKPETWNRLVSTLSQIPLPNSESNIDTIAQSVTVQPKEEIDALLLKLGQFKTWTNPRRDILGKILKLIEDEKYLIFSGDSRTYRLQTRGSYKYMYVPTTQRGTLAQFKGKWIRLICISYSPKWPNHSGRIFAAKPVSIQLAGPLSE
jgi:N-formylglutamate deformylase